MTDPPTSLPTISSPLANELADNVMVELIASTLASSSPFTPEFLASVGAHTRRDAITVAYVTAIGARLYALAGGTETQGLDTLLIRAFEQAILDVANTMLDVGPPARVAGRPRRGLFRWLIGGQP